MANGHSQRDLNVCEHVCICLTIYNAHLVKIFVNKKKNTRRRKEQKQEANYCSRL